MTNSIDDLDIRSSLVERSASSDEWWILNKEGIKAYPFATFYLFKERQLEDMFVDKSIISLAEPGSEYTHILPRSMVRIAPFKGNEYIGYIQERRIGVFRTPSYGELWAPHKKFQETKSSVLDTGDLETNGTKPETSEAFDESNARYFSRDEWENYTLEELLSIEPSSSKIECSD